MPALEERRVLSGTIFISLKYCKLMDRIGKSSIQVELWIYKIVHIG